MKTLFLIAMPVLATPAFAHSGVGEHVHPHGDGGLLTLAAALLILCAAFAAGRSVLLARRAASSKSRR